MCCTAKLQLQLEHRISLSNLKFVQGLRHFKSNKLIIVTIQAKAISLAHTSKFVSSVLYCIIAKNLSII